MGVAILPCNDWRDSPERKNWLNDCVIRKSTRCECGMESFHLIENKHVEKPFWCFNQIGGEFPAGTKAKIGLGAYLARLKISNKNLASYTIKNTKVRGFKGAWISSAVGKVVKSIEGLSGRVVTVIVDIGGVFVEVDTHNEELEPREGAFVEFGPIDSAWGIYKYSRFKILDIQPAKGRDKKTISGAYIKISTNGRELWCFVPDWVRDGWSLDLKGSTIDLELYLNTESYMKGDMSYSSYVKETDSNRRAIGIVTWVGSYDPDDVLDLAYVDVGGIVEMITRKGRFKVGEHIKLEERIYARKLG